MTAVEIPNRKAGLSLEDLYNRNGLLKLDALFLARLGQSDAALRERLNAARAQPHAVSTLQESELLLALSPHVDDFVGWLFDIEDEVQALSARHHELAPLYRVKRLFVQRKAMHKIKGDEAEKLDGAALAAQLEALMGEALTELAFALHVTAWQKDETANAGALATALSYAAWAAHSAAGRHKHLTGVLFKSPHKLDPQHLVPATADTTQGYTQYHFKTEQLRRRPGFKLTDPGTDLTGALDQAHYCIWCHEQGKDSCSKGLLEKGATGRGAASFKKNPFGITLAGCPLEEKISEFQKAKTEGHAIGAFAIIV
ncbi:MAG: hypothetical protein Q8L40_03110, partial [Burkholderiales bacterium]|nr:hypothetical protein [Burkholderiales bacterium]